MTFLTAPSVTFYVGAIYDDNGLSFHAWKLQDDNEYDYESQASSSIQYDYYGTATTVKLRLHVFFSKGTTPPPGFWVSAGGLTVTSITTGELDELVYEIEAQKFPATFGLDVRIGRTKLGSATVKVARHAASEAPIEELIPPPPPPEGGPNPVGHDFALVARGAVEAILVYLARLDLPRTRPIDNIHVSLLNTRTEMLALEEEMRAMDGVNNVKLRALARKGRGPGGPGGPGGRGHGHSQQ